MTRTIKLREYSAKPYDLTQTEAKELAAVTPGFVDLSLRSDGLVDVRAKAHIGTIVLPSVNLLIRPKVDIQDVFYLLSYAQGIRWSAAQFPYESTDDLFASLVWFFDAEMERARVSGLTRDYIEREETLATVRGRINIAEQLRRRGLMPYPLECRFQEYTEDVPLNWTLKGAHSIALSVPRLEETVARRVRDRYRRLFAGVQSEYQSAGEAQQVLFNRFTQHWEPAYWLARLLLGMQSLRDETGSISGQAFTVRMDRVFERYAETVLTEELTAVGLEVVPQMPLAFTSDAHVVGRPDKVYGGVGMRPDIVVKRDGKTVAVADVKYKVTEDIGDFQQPDVVQLFAYTATLGISRGLLLYADSQPHMTQRAVLPAFAGQVAVDSVGIDLTKDWRSIERQTREAAAILISIAFDESDRETRTGG